MSSEDNTATHETTAGFHEFLQSEWEAHWPTGLICAHAEIDTDTEDTDKVKVALLNSVM